MKNIGESIKKGKHGLATSFDSVKTDGLLERQSWVPNQGQKLVGVQRQDGAVICRNTPDQHGPLEPEIRSCRGQQARGNLNFDFHPYYSIFHDKCVFNPKRRITV